MRKILLALFLASPCLASGPKQIGSNVDPAIYREFVDVYQEIANPNINIGTASTMTITQLNVSTITAISINTTTLTASTGSIKSFMVNGDTLGTTPCAGCLGEYIESQVLFASRVNSPATTVWGDLTSITLTPGVWDVSYTGTINYNGTIDTEFYCGISTTTGNSSAGLVPGINTVTTHVAANIFAASTLLSVTGSPINLPVYNYRMYITASQSVYAKIATVRASGTPAFYGKLFATRAF